MPHLVFFIPLMIIAIVAMMTWTVSKYVEVQDHWRAQTRVNPRGRPVVSRPIVMPAHMARPLRGKSPESAQACRAEQLV